MFSTLILAPPGGYAERGLTSIPPGVAPDATALAIGAHANDDRHGHALDALRRAYFNHDATAARVAPWSPRRQTLRCGAATMHQP
jgi:hypothetical protein